MGEEQVPERRKVSSGDGGRIAMWVGLGMAAIGVVAIIAGYAYVDMLCRAVARIITGG